MKVPAGGKYLLSIPESPVAPVRVEGQQATLEAPAGIDKFTLRVVDEQTGYAARRSLETKSLPAEVVFAPSDLKLVSLVRVRVTGKGDKPVARAAVILTDSQKKAHQLLLEPARNGEVEIQDVAEGKGTLEVFPQAPDPSVSRGVDIALSKGETTQTLTFAAPDVTAVVEGAASTPPGSGGGTATPPAGTAGTAAPPVTATPAAPAQAPPDGGGATNIFQTVLSFAILAAIGFGIYTYGKKQGWTIEGAMARLGVQPQAVATSVGPGSAPGPVAAPPPPVVADPNRCQFCGELKDSVSGACACALTSTAPGFGAAPSWGGVPGAAPGDGPRLVATAGVYMGEIFRIHGDMVIGRDVTNPLPLDRDTTVSRRHARIAMDGSGFRLFDEGSSNGTFVNGAKVSDALLQPGDEVSIGGTRFRFEV